MNIVEEYINRNKQLVILISGFSGSGKSVLARSLLKDINRNNKKYEFTFLNLNDFLIIQISAGFHLSSPEIPLPFLC